MGRLIRVLVVDDSSFIRHILTRYLEDDPDIVVVGQARDGLDALDKIPTLKPDVVTLDVQMPRLDGLATLRRINQECPTPVVMLSALTQRGARTTIQALMRGAVDFVSKPSSPIDTPKIVDELIEKIKAATGVRPVSLLPTSTPAPAPKCIPRTFRRRDPLVIIGASTGGPRALQQVLSELPGDLPAAVVVVQHMSSGFTQALAQRLNSISKLTVQEAVDGDRLARGLALVAPGGFHLQFQGIRKVVLNQGPRRNGVRPAVDITLESAAEHFASVIGVILTGMGSDGLDGARQVKKMGGKIIAEHESTSVIYGMPRSVVEAGLADKVLPLSKVASTLAEWVKRPGGG